MRKIKFKELDLKDFMSLGSYVNMLVPDCEKFDIGPIEFFRDMVLVDLAEKHSASISMVRVQERPLVVDVMEFHSCGEGFMPMDADMLIPLAAATLEKNVVPEKIALYRVPKGTFVSLRPGVWHNAPFPYKSKSVSFLVVLPERTYATDDYCDSIPAEGQIQVQI